jgi:hypothetical protein
LSGLIDQTNLGSVDLAIDAQTTVIAFAFAKFIVTIAETTAASAA